MKKRLLTPLFLLFSAIAAFSQTDSTDAGNSSTTITPEPAEQPPPTGFIFKPTIGLGTGMFSFYGDLYNKHFQAPMVSRIGYDLQVSQRLTSYLQLNFYVLFGKLGANERIISANRYLNFESQIRVGGVNLMYDFGNFLPPNRQASPYITLGFESFEFLSKTDLFDKSGNRYNYWSDGTIRNLPENHPMAATAQEISRDYTYESDIRELNLDNFGKYAERSFALPVGAGVMMKINDYWTFRIGATMHFTFTDYIDGVTEKSTAERAGNSKNDNFMMSSFSLHYNLGTKKKDPENKQPDADFSDVDFFALDMQDSDKDGVTDLTDSCQGTPEGVAVDTKGCPVDDDEDGVPNHMDDELSSPKGAFVDQRGVQLTDSLIAYQYAFYMDSTGAFATVEYHNYNGTVNNKPNSNREYTVELGTFRKGLPAELMTKFLSIGDIASTNLNDSTTIYTAGSFYNQEDAEKRKNQLVADGMTDAKVVYKQNGKYFIPSPAITGNIASNSASTDTTGNKTGTNASGNNTTTGENNTTGNNTTGNNTTGNNTGNTTTGNNTEGGNTTTNNAQFNEQGIVLRVQLGAYKKKLSKNVFRNINDLIEVKTEDGLYKYMTGSFSTFEEAAKHKVEMSLIGYQGAFIAAYKDGKRVSLKDAGALPVKKEEFTDISDNSAVSGVNKKLVVFKVQIGAFKSEPPADQQAKFDKIKGLKKELTPAGLNRYIAGSFSTYEAALAYKNTLVSQGLTDSFVVAFFNGQYVTLQEAQELLK